MTRFFLSLRFWSIDWTGTLTAPARRSQPTGRQLADEMYAYRTRLSNQPQ